MWFSDNLQDCLPSSFPIDIVIMDPPKTPKSKTPHLVTKAVTSTPFSTHLSSRSDFMKSAAVEVVDRHISQDLKTFRTCEAGSFLQFLFSYTERDLQMDGNEAAKQARLDKETVTLLDSYRILVADLGAGETSYYHPFCLLANHVL